MSVPDKIPPRTCLHPLRMECLGDCQAHAREASSYGSQSMLPRRRPLILNQTPNLRISPVVR